MINIYLKGNNKFNCIPYILNKRHIIFKGSYNSKVPHSKEENSGDTNILIICKKNYKDDFQSNYFEKIIDYDELMNYLFLKYRRFYYNNYDYLFLKNAIKVSKKKDVNSIIVGLSYAMLGINEQALKIKAINLALPSQDLYYSFKISKAVIDRNKEIKNCIIGLGYYSFNFDLSLCKNSESSRIDNVYYPIFKDFHNYNHCKKMPVKNFSEYIDNRYKSIFDTRKLENCLWNIQSANTCSYFNSTISRRIYSTLGNISLKKLNESAKIKFSKDRAASHNKLLKYKKTYEEYKILIYTFIKYLNERNVVPVIVIFPALKYYRDELSPDFKNEFYSIINSAASRHCFKIIDLFDSKLFNEDDFMDTDHLNEKGALKVSKIINSKIFI